jgi:hypothetical protein
MVLANYRHTGEDVKVKVKRLLNVWRERKLFGSDVIDRFEAAGGLNSMYILDLDI